MNFLASAISNLQVKWLEQLGATRKESLQRKAIALLPSAPVVDAKLMSSMLGADVSQTIRTLNTLADSGILEQVTSGKRNRVWVASEIIRILEEYDFSVRV
jgi:Fic family protein